MEDAREDSSAKKWAVAYQGLVVSDASEKN
jgi:hypothetical protein